MNNIIELFQQYVTEDSHILSIYENDECYICILDFNSDYKGEGPCLPIVYYYKDTKEYKEVYPQQDNSIIRDTKNSECIYGEELFWEDDGLLDRDIDA